MIREIVTIDEELCDGCGMCVPSCHEGAIRIIDGKARLVSENLCDGLGACLGHCPRGAIRIERREADQFDERAVKRHLAGEPVAEPQHAGGSPAGGCPSSRPASFAPGAASSGGGCPGSRFAHFVSRGADPNNIAPFADKVGAAPSALTHWPVQLHLLPPGAPVLRGAKLLVAADCVPVAYGGFHSEMLRDHAVVIACPKLDDTSIYVDKFAEMFRVNDLAEVSVARMEVPCCSGILHMVLEGRRRSGANTPVFDIVISTRGERLAQREVPLNN